MARFLIDESMPSILAPMLRDAGYEATDAREAGLQGRPDEDVYAAAERLQAIVVSKDKDFSDERDFIGQAGIILVRVHHRWHRQAVADFALEQIRRYEAEIENLDRTIMVIVPGHHPRYRAKA